MSIDYEYEQESNLIRTTVIGALTSEDILRLAKEVVADNEIKEGFIEITTRRWSSQIIGATIMAPRAGEMLMQISVAMQSKIPLRKFASLIHPYPIFNLGIRKAADMWLMRTFFKRS